jgi:hypothetical protein
MLNSGIQPVLFFITCLCDICIVVKLIGLQLLYKAQFSFKFDIFKAELNLIIKTEWRIQYGWFIDNTVQL